MADYLSSAFKDAGIESVETFELDVLLNYPSSPPTLKVSNPDGQVTFAATLSEDILPEDSTSDTPWRNTTFHGYAPSGSVSAPAVFANYGRPSDFDDLEAANISVEGKIVLVRYGQCFRGLKVMNAQNRGAVGVLVYSDPQDDGFEYGKCYPEGPWRSASSVQRGSVQFNSICAGDPMRADKRYEEMGESLTSLCGVKDYTSLIPSIPSIPISYGDAQPILSQLGGVAAEALGDDWVGALPITYTTGPSTSIVSMSTDNEFKVTSIPNVIGKIPGSLPASDDHPVLLGNHRDAWVFGAADPNSGTASLIEVAKGLGSLVQSGWQPKHTIYLLSWSGEEYGLLGSTGWAELNFDAISSASAYINVDTVVSGDELTASATPALTSLWEGVMADLDGHVLFKNGPSGNVLDANVNAPINADDAIGTLGSGSDYTVFLDHFGIASLDFEFNSPAGTYGVYHSIYDSFDWIDNYGGIDGEKGSSFELMASAAKMWGVLALRLADSDVLPFDHVKQAEALVKYSAAVDGNGLDLSELNSNIDAYMKAAQGVAEEMNSPGDLKDLNFRLSMTERSFLNADGLPGRSWMKHVLQAPGFYLGYAAMAFPGVQQAVDDGDLDLAQQQVAVVAECVDKAATFLKG
ncbi:hypothetical protein TrVE_jg5999 [Triparma verrucosa]|uniref:Glutamate carboxypeptidase n=1 Tax=Triparma verrucosa TaxID=1606542 RepID=A0A9W7BQZ8_9STRA|nr:hypothetical protein TrVE_jg5999 [Triparma verrucosa]